MKAALSAGHEPSTLGVGYAVKRDDRSLRLGRMARACACALTVSAGGGAFASSARAFSDPAAYTDDVELGGGGGRWFTGSSADGFGCEVCHEGGPVADIAIGGLPLDGFQPGAAYEITIGWPATVEHVALLAELTDEARMGVGTLELPRPDATPEAERCSGELLGAPSSAISALEDQSGRQIVSVVDCGARQLRFKWTAPAAAPESVWLNVGFVAANDDAMPEGDGVTMARRVLHPSSAAVEPKVVAQGCDAAHAGRSASSSLVPLCLLALLAWRRAHQTLEALRCKR